MFSLICVGERRVGESQEETPGYPLLTQGFWVCSPIPPQIQGGAQFPSQLLALIPGLPVISDVSLLQDFPSIFTPPFPSGMSPQVNPPFPYPAAGTPFGSRR